MNMRQAKNDSIDAGGDSVEQAVLPLLFSSQQLMVFWSYLNRAALISKIS